MTQAQIPAVSQALRDALVLVYPGYVRHRTGRFGPVAGLDQAIEAGSEWLESQLDSLLSLPFQEQRRAPLELFQEAMKYPTAALTDAGHEPARRDAVTTSALPGDLYDLAPASTRDLGDDLWARHLEWGAAKAQAIKSLL